MSRALIVDDDAVARVVLRHMMTAQGFDVIEASSADDAQEILDTACVEVIVCDYLMPGRTGLDLLESLGKDAPPFVLLTGALNRTDLGDSRVDGVSAYITKPVSTEELNRVTAPYIGPLAA